MNRTFKRNRQGITLLFVISMIVLFLLMGTAFIVVANNFNRESTNRILRSVPEGDGTQQSNQLLEQGMLQLIHGPDLRDINSPLRAVDMLSDQYGYGFKTFVSVDDVTPRIIGGGAFVEVAFRADPNEGATQGQCFDLLSRSTTPQFLGLDIDGDNDDDLIGGLYGGQVLSFTSGPAKGFSARIHFDFYDSNDVHIFRIPTASISGVVITEETIDPTINDFAGSEVIINGRDFSGTGAAVMLDSTGNPDTLGTQALLPNRVGQLHEDLAATNDNPSSPYLSRTSSGGTTSPNFASVNEPWDAADIATPFLSGRSKRGELIPSFYRLALLNSGTASTVSSGRTFFHAFDNGDDKKPDVDTDGDGRNDSFWMDLGMSITTNRLGQRFKPLYAVQIRSMDGLLNVNAHSNLTHLRTDGYVNQQQTLAGGVTQVSSPLGGGMGVPEINLTNAVGGIDNLTVLLNERYGADGLPGNGLTSFQSRAKLFGYPNDIINPSNGSFGTIGGLFNSAMDIHGRFNIGSPASSRTRISGQDVDDFRDLNFQDVFNNGLPQINMLTSNEDLIDLIKPGETSNELEDEFSGNPYEMDLNGDSTFDRSFTAEELEGLLRSNDIDSGALPGRLLSVLSLNDNLNKQLFTTVSNDVPMLHRGFVTELLQEIPQRNSNLSGEQLIALIKSYNFQNQFAFATELYRGLKMDINRPFGDGRDNNDNGVIDEPGEEVDANNTDATALLGGGTETNMDLNYDGVRNGDDAAPLTNPRQIYARHLYMLAMLKLAPVDLDGDGTISADPTDLERLQFAKAIAQWAVNVVDFRDPDSIHTRFIYDPTPFDTGGWTVTVDSNGEPTGTTDAVWGAERPELLLTETLAVHIQNTEVSDTGSYEQRLRPEPFAFFEVYNPWTQNRLNQTFDQSLYLRFGVELTNTAPGGAPVWRFEVERAEVPADSTTPTQYKPLRYVYTTDPGDSVTYTDSENKNQTASDIEVFYSSGGRTLVRPGRQAVIGTKGFENDDKFEVYMGRKTAANDQSGASAENLMLDQTTRLSFDSDNGITPGTIERFTDSNDADSTRSAMIVFIDQAKRGDGTGTAAERKFSLSDPYEGYPDFQLTEIPDGDGFVYTTPTAPLDKVDGDRITAEDLAMIRSQDGTNKNFRYVRLQRLANPLIAWNAVTNPYLTIDSMEVDLVTINGAATPDTSLESPTSADNAVSLEKGDANRALWGFQRQASIRTASSTASTSHFYAGSFDESLGRTNDLFEPAETTNTNPFAWLTWNNRPFISHTEIMNVPYLAPDRLTYAPETGADPGHLTQPFTINDGTVTDPYGTTSNTGTTDSSMATRPGSLAGRYGHLLNFFASEDSTTNSVLDAYKLLDFIEVPSRFVGTESYYLTAGVSEVAKHPYNTISNYRDPGKVNINDMPARAVWDAVNAEQVTWNTFQNSLYGDYQTTPTGSTDFENPFRPAAWANLVPGRDVKISGSACTLMRPVQVGSATQVPLLDYTKGSIADDPTRSAAFQNSIRTRLGNLVTTKSSVFACWISVGYFEVDVEGDLVDTSGNKLNMANPSQPVTLNGKTVSEIGVETGEQVRQRGFFIFDRSIPVAFEPGKNHNVEDAILIKSIIE